MIRLLVLLLLCLLSPLSSSAEERGELKIIVSKTQIIVGEMVLVTIRGEYDHRITLEELDQPKLPDFDWIQLNRDNWKDERINGQLFHVFERNLAVFPRKSGMLSIGPFSHKLTIVSGNGRAERIYKAQPVTISVAPFPVSGKPFSASSLTLEDDLSTSPAELVDGEVLVRRVTLTVQGTLSHMIPARPNMRAPWLITFTAPGSRESNPDKDGPISKVVWEWRLRPKTGEPGVLPQVDIPWFNTETRKMETATIKAIPFGYASFALNKAGTTSLKASAGWLAIAIFAISAIFTALWILSGFNLQSTESLRKKLLSSLPDPTLRTLLTLAKNRIPPLELRQPFEAFLLRRSYLEKQPPLAAKKLLDDHVYGKAVGDFDYEKFIQLLKS